MNNARKEVLFKFVITTLSTYVMNVFKIPTTWCEEINSTIATFWWGARNEDWKIHRKRWEAMAVSNKEGGFHFRKFNSFNTTLLANPATRLVTEPNALWARVLKGLYFPSLPSSCGEGGRASWGWSSLLARREVLKSEGVWTIGDDRSVRSFRDKWVP